MKLAIQNSTRGFHPRWISYCKENNIAFKLVNCYDSNIVQELEDCDILLWHHHHFSAQDVLFAKQLFFSLEQAGKIVFPDFNTGWHFDDKVGQKYMLEALGLPLVPSYVFYEKEKALSWARQTSYPKVWKLRGGAGSSNVRLVENQYKAFRVINKAFGTGFKQYNSFESLKERYRKFRNQKADFLQVIKGVIRLFYSPLHSKVMGREIGYVYFQEFMPNNKSDIRVIVIDNKAFGLKRMVREGDFRASGSGEFHNRKEDIDIRCVKIAFDAADKIKTKSGAFDFVFDEQNNPLIVEISFGFSVKAYESCPGYWDKNLNWVLGSFNPYGWIVQSAIKELKGKSI
jgi:glutathione synthase/RimK-type ligase-like ATP-grasp enzyme